jgi:hypothetical protein
LVFLFLVVIVNIITNTTAIVTIIIVIADVVVVVMVQPFFLIFQGLDQLRNGLLQQQKPFIQAPQPFHQLQMLTPQHQQQLMLAQQNLTSPSSDESRRLRMLLNNRSMALGKDGLTNSVGDVVSNVGSPLQAGGPLLGRGDTDMLLKVILSLSITLPSAVIDL